MKRLVKYSRKPVAIFCGDINIANLPDIYMIVESLPDWDTMKIREALVVERSSSWTECPICHIVGLARHAFPSLLPCGCCKDADKSPSIVAAYAEARKARFEYEDAKPKQKIKSSPSLVQQAQEQFKEAIRQMQVETKKPSSLPDWDDVPLPDEFNKTNDVHQEPKGVAPLPDWDDVPLPDEFNWDNVPQTSSALTMDEIKNCWPLVQRRVKSKKDGAKIAATLNGYNVVGLEGTREFPVIVLQSVADFYYSALSSRVDYLATLEWAIKVELKQEFKVRLMEPPKWDKPRFKANDLVKHHTFGEGVVLKSELEGNVKFVVVQFHSEYGKKRLAMNFAKLENLGNPF